MNNAELLKAKLAMGTILYTSLTEGNKKGITQEQAEKLTDEELDALFFFTLMNDLDYEEDLVALESILVLTDESDKRNPIDFSPEESLEEFKAKYSEFFR